MSVLGIAPPVAARSSVAPRLSLALVGLAQAVIGVWGTVAPHSFWSSFPGAGHHWVAALGPYDEHLVRDYASSELGFTVLLLAAAWLFGRTLVLVACATFLIGSVPHFLYHAVTTGPLSTGDNIGDISGFALELIVVGIVMAGAWRSPTSERTA
jgi:hypothetical protein